MSNLPNPPISVHPVHLPPPTTTTLQTALSSCKSLSQIKQIHAQILRSNTLNVKSRSLLVNFLLSSPSLHYALSVFSHLPHPLLPAISTPFLRHLTRSNNPELTLIAYQKLRENGVEFDPFSLPPLLKAATRVSALPEGRELHGFVFKLGLYSDPYIQTGLVGMYSSCGKISDARMVFDKVSHRDVVVWSRMINGYFQNGLFDDVLELFDEMKRGNVEPDEIILSTILSACGKAGNLSYGKVIHEYIYEKNLRIDSHLLSTLVSMYASCGCMDTAQELFEKMGSRDLVVSTSMISGYSRVGRVEDARLLFDQIVKKDLVCWSAMISGYAESNNPQEALRLFKEMQILRIKPDNVTMLSVISACAHLGLLGQAQWIHAYVDRNGFGGVLSVNNALIDLYSKCGSLERARGIFESMKRRNVISWSTMINAFALHGDAKNALKFFDKMKKENTEPNEITFIGVLYACSHAGLVEEGRKLFSSMIHEHKITPQCEHYGCMVDLFGRANCLREALEVIETMPLAPNAITWGSLMAACRIHGESELGEFAAKRLLELEPDHDGALVLLSNLHAKEGRWEDVGEVRKTIKDRGIFKEKACSRIELDNEVHDFLIADRNHEQADKIYAKLDEVVSLLKLAGYTPNTSCVLIDLEEEEKKEKVLWHSEKLALCYGLIRGGGGSCIRIVKNLRVCEDCHTFLKLVSMVYEREIVVRDRKRFHHYKDGVCSCNDYW